MKTQMTRSHHLQALVCVGLFSVFQATHATGRTEYVSPKQSEEKASPAKAPASSVNVLSVSVPFAHELESARGRYCSPEVVIYNNSAFVIKSLLLTVDFFQKNGSDKSTFVGSTVTHARMLGPRSEKRETFYVLDTVNCSGLQGFARVPFCVVGESFECAPVGFSSGGRVPLRPAGPSEGDGLLFAPARDATSTPAPVGR